MSESQWLEIDTLLGQERRRVEELERENDSLRSRCAKLEAALMDQLGLVARSP
jgi:hypothetical protein